MLMNTIATQATPFNFDLDLSQNALTMEEQFSELRKAHDEATLRHEMELKNARQEGEATGRASTEAQAAEALSKHLSKVAQTASRLLSTRDDMHKNLESQASQLAFAAGQFLARAALKNSPHAEIESLLATAMNDVSEVPHLVLHLPEGTAAEVEPRLMSLLDQHGYGGRLVIKSEANWADQDIRLVWADGELVRDQQASEMMIQKQILSYFEGKA